MSLVDANGQPINGSKPASPIATVDGLPGWMKSANYRSDDDIITMVVHVPRSSHAIDHLLALEMTPADARVVIDVLTKLVAQSERVVLDVSPSDP